MTNKASIQTYIDYAKEQYKLLDEKIYSNEDHNVAEWLEYGLQDVPEMETVYTEGGGEGGGEHVEIVFRIKDKLFAVYGSYYSYDGTHWDDIWDFTEVKEVPAVAYEAV